MEPVLAQCINTTTKKEPFEYDETAARRTSAKCVSHPAYDHRFQPRVKKSPCVFLPTVASGRIHQLFFKARTANKRRGCFVTMS